jgi:hypothetical protein
MTVTQIKRKRITIQNKINLLREQLGELQNLCKHPNVEKKYGGDSGNYDPSQDCYWIDWNCPDCGSRWTTDQSRENVLKPGKEIR